jgi:hypothetical protein
MYASPTLALPVRLLTVPVSRFLRGMRRRGKGVVWSPLLGDPWEREHSALAASMFRDAKKAQREGLVVGQSRPRPTPCRQTPPLRGTCARS